MRAVPDAIENIDRCIALRSYVQAYYGVLSGLEARPADPGLIAASSRLAAALRSRMMDLSSSKATDQGEEEAEAEALLRLVIRLNGEGIYPPRSAMNL